MFHSIVGLIEKGANTMTDEEKLQRIYAAASELFIQPGYHETQMQMIAQWSQLAGNALPVVYQ